MPVPPQALRIAAFPIPAALCAASQCAVVLATAQRSPRPAHRRPTTGIGVVFQGLCALAGIFAPRCAEPRRGRDLLEGRRRSGRIGVPSCEDAAPSGR